jgi:hypothetical protein
MPEKGPYKLVLDGRILAGHNLDDVKSRLARLLKSDIKKIELLLAEAPLTIKSNIDYPTASKYKESLNFQISLMIYYIAATLLILIIIGFFLLIGLFIFNIITVIIAGIKANEGESYQYPMTIRFIK